MLEYSINSYSLIFRFFISIDWAEVMDRKMIPPIIPKITFEGDTRNFEDHAEYIWAHEKISNEDLLLFQDF